MFKINFQARWDMIVKAAELFCGKQPTSFPGSSRNHLHCGNEKNTDWAQAVGLLGVCSVCCQFIKYLGKLLLDLE